MIKIERLNNGAKATIVRNGVTQPVYLGMSITAAELETLQTIGGSIVYTIDETEIVELQGGQSPEPVKSAEPAAASEPAVETAAEAAPQAQVIKPAIVKPTPRKK